MDATDHETRDFSGELRKKIASQENVSQALGHFLFGHRDERVMHPIFHERSFTACGFGLRDFVLVMRKGQVLSAMVEIDLVAEPFSRHRRAFDMPARSTFSPGRVPIRLAWLCRLPERKIEGILLLGSRLHASTSDQL